MNKKVYFLSLGCPRNLVDSEVLLGILEKKGFKLTDNAEKASLGIINTCAFIDEAVEETIDIILELCRLKNNSHLKKIIVCGCFVQRFGKKLIEELPEVDAFIGANEIEKIDKVVEEVFQEKRVFCCFEEKNFIYNKESPRRILTPKYTAYLKISEGCRYHCSYCIIPSLKGKYRSRSIEDIVGEAENLSAAGYKEFNIIGQDTSSYGFDLYRKESLARLLRELVKIKGIEWIRLLYAHPNSFTQELIETIAFYPKICKYIDIPVQHISTKILKAMNRNASKKDIINLIKKLKTEIKNVCLRTTLLVGFPGEEEKDFEELLEFMKLAQFERLGIFKYSKQDGTTAASLKKQVPEKIKNLRFDKAFKLQREIAKKINERFIGKQLKVIIDKVEKDYALGRTEFDSPEVDGLVYVYSNKKLKPGSFAIVEITDSLEYDLVGRTIK
ncbi:MAG: 30S ribosomal protein S12 methylthiotransferase RimO [Candidatus Omnitrophota bacterium]